MRKQYHARRSGGHVLIWDVDRLIALARDLPVIDVPLEQLRELDEAYWFLPGDPGPTCRAVVEHARLIDAADPQQPIILCPQGRVMDGMHRVGRALLLGMKMIRARQFPELPGTDYVDVPLASLPYEDAGSSPGR